MWGGKGKMEVLNGGGIECLIHRKKVPIEVEVAMGT